MENNFIASNNPPANAINPITFQQIPEALKGVQNKRPEEKLYIIMYYYGEDEKGFELCIGRMECYETIGRLIVTYPDLQIFNSVVLVEVLYVNRDNKAEWVLKHPYNAPTIYQFCKNTEQFFPNSDFHIDDYVTDAQQEAAEAETKIEVVPEQITMSIPIDEDPMVKVYKDIMKVKENNRMNDIL